MTQYHFNILDENEKANIVWNKGILIGERSDQYYNVSLFQVDDFYVEVFRHSHFNVITRFRSFSNTRFLEPYLQEISLEGIL